VKHVRRCHPYGVDIGRADRLMKIAYRTSESEVANSASATPIVGVRTDDEFGRELTFRKQ